MTLEEWNQLASVLPPLCLCWGGLSWRLGLPPPAEIPREGIRAALLDTPPSEGEALCGRVLLAPPPCLGVASPAALEDFLDIPTAREQSDLDLKSADLAAFFVGEVTGSSGFLIAGDFLGDSETAGLEVPGLPGAAELEREGDRLDLAEGDLLGAAEYEREGGTLDFTGEGDLEVDLDPRTFIGELELLPGAFVGGVSETLDLEDGTLDRWRSRSLKNFGMETDFLGLLSSPPPKLISHAKDS